MVEITIIENSTSIKTNDINIFIDGNVTWRLVFKRFLFL